MKIFPSFKTQFLALALITLTGLFSVSGVGAIAFSQEPSDTRIVINIPARTLSLFQNGVLHKQYPVGVGRVGFPTPSGQFQVLRKIVNPGWENPYKPSSPSTRVAPGGDNPLGTRWIGFKEDGSGEYGIHGTDTPTSVGKYSSHGCVRMQIKDVEEVFDLVSVGTPVQVTYNPVLAQANGPQLKAKVFTSPFSARHPSLETIHQEIQSSFPGFQVNRQWLASAVQQPAASVLKVIGISKSETLNSAMAVKNPALPPSNTGSFSPPKTTSQKTTSLPPIISQKRDRALTYVAVDETLSPSEKTVPSDLLLESLEAAAYRDVINSRRYQK